MRKVNYLGMNGNEQLLLGKMTFFTPASIQVQAHYVYDISIVWAAGVWFLCNVTVFTPDQCEVFESVQQCSILPQTGTSDPSFCWNGAWTCSQIICLSVCSRSFPAGTSFFFISIWDLHLYAWLCTISFLTCVFSPALIICLTLAFQDCLSPKVMCVDWRISSKLKCDWCSVARRNSSAKCRWASLQLYAWSQAYTQVHTFSILHV